jgi:hypothetical protein
MKFLALTIKKKDDLTFTQLIDEFVPEAKDWWQNGTSKAALPSLWRCLRRSTCGDGCRCTSAPPQICGTQDAARTGLRRVEERGSARYGCIFVSDWLSVSWRRHALMEEPRSQA